MEPIAFKVTMYKCVIDSGWVQISPLTVLVGKNESGKTSLLRALHKFSPFTPQPYDLNREWPRGHRDTRSEDQVVCAVRFRLAPEERNELENIAGQSLGFQEIEVARDYKGRLEILWPNQVFPQKLHPSDVDAILKKLPQITQALGDTFREAAQKCHDEAVRLAHEGRFSDLGALHAQHRPLLQQARTSGNPQPQHNNENTYIEQFVATLTEVSKKLIDAPSIQKKAHDFLVSRLPTFVYMDEYRYFCGSAMLDQVLQRKNSKHPQPDDETLVTILELSGLELERLVAKGNEEDREQRQYDLDDGGVTLTNKVEKHWGQLRYDVTFRADGQQLLTFIKDPKDRALIRLDERSRGFQWFFSFDLLLMHETRGKLKDCVILLDEPGLHLHPEGQRDLLLRLEEYAKGNTLIYTTHLPFMIDLQCCVSRSLRRFRRTVSRFLRQRELAASRCQSEAWINDAIERMP